MWLAALSECHGACWLWDKYVHIIAACCERLETIMQIDAQNCSRLHIFPSMTFANYYHNWRILHTHTRYLTVLPFSIQGFFLSSYAWLQSSWWRGTKLMRIFQTSKNIINFHKWRLQISQKARPRTIIVVLEIDVKIPLYGVALKRKKCQNRVRVHCTTSQEYCVLA